MLCNSVPHVYACDELISHMDVAVASTSRAQADWVVVVEETALPAGVLERVLGRRPRTTAVRAAARVVEPRATPRRVARAADNDQPQVPVATAAPEIADSLRRGEEIHRGLVREQADEEGRQEQRRAARNQRPAAMTFPQQQQFDSDVYTDLIRSSTSASYRTIIAASQQLVKEGAALARRRHAVTPAQADAEGQSSTDKTSIVTRGRRQSSASSSQSKVVPETRLTQSTVVPETKVVPEPTRRMVLRPTPARAGRRGYLVGARHAVGDVNHASDAVNHLYVSREAARAAPVGGVGRARA